MTSHDGHATPLLKLVVDRIADELARSEVDGWLVYDFRGSNPAFGRLLGNSASMSTRRAFLFVPRASEPRLLIHHVDAGNFARLGFAVQAYGGRGEMLERLAGLVGGARRVLMEYSPGNAIPYVSRVDAGTLEMVRAFGVEVLSSADALASVIAAWDAADIASHERAAQALDRSREALYDALRQHLARHDVWTEWDAQQFLAARMQAEGLEFDHAPIVAVGPHAGDPHYAPAPEVALPISPGDLILTDLWARESSRPDGGPGAYADITWMATATSVAKVPPEQRRVWTTVRDARDAAVSFLQERVRPHVTPVTAVTPGVTSPVTPVTAVTPGVTSHVTGGEVDRVARAVIERAGYGAHFTHRTGHSLGWSAAHGDGVNIDDFETHDTRLLRPGAAFSIEPGIYLDDFGVRSEINVVVTPEGTVRVTTPPQRDLVSLV